MIEMVAGLTKLSRTAGPSLGLAPSEQSDTHGY